MVRSARRRTIESLNTAVADSNPAPATSRNDQSRFYAVFRGAYEFTDARPSSSFLCPRHDFGYGIGVDVASLGRISLFLRFPAGPG